MDSQLKKQGDKEVPTRVRSDLVAVMTDLCSPDVDWGGYSKGWDVRRQDRNNVRISARPGEEGAAGARGDARGGVVTGLVTGIAGNALRVRTEEGSTQNIGIAEAADLDVVRNGKDARLRDVRQGDQVRVTLNADRVPTRIVATSRAAPARRSGPNPGWLLLLVPPFLLMKGDRDDELVVEQQQSVVDSRR